MSMHAIILAAGRGSRMGNLTESAPKCLTVLGGRTLLDWQMWALLSAGIRRVGIVRGYQGQQLQRPGIEFFENPAWQQSNMVRSLMAASQWLGQTPCLVSYSDIVYSPETAAALMACGDNLAIAFDPDWLSLWSRRFSDPLSDAETFSLGADGKLSGIGERAWTVEEIQGQYTGLIKFTPQAWQVVSDFLGSLPPETVDRLDMTTLLRLLIAQGVSIGAVAQEAGWYEVDSEFDLRLYEQELKEGSSWLNQLLR